MTYLNSDLKLLLLVSEGIVVSLVLYPFQAMSSLPIPPVMLLDPNDENIILGIPEDADLNKENSVPAQVVKKVILRYP